MAMASRAKARKVQKVTAIWCVARLTSVLSEPTRVTAYVPTNRQARSAIVRMTSATAAWAAVRIPARSGESGAPWARAARTTTTISAAAESTWAMTEPSADPPIPRSRP